MKTLLILRHAKSSWDDPSLPDHDRPLKKRGRKAAPRMGELLREKNLVPELVISSTAVRARDTARRAAEAMNYGGDLRLDSELYLAEPATIRRVIGDAGGRQERIMIVGHNPGLEELVESFAGRHERFPTGALAQVELDIEQWSEMPAAMGSLVELWRPKDLE